MNRFKEIFSSPRFQQILMAAILLGLKIYQDTGNVKNAIITAAIALLTTSTTVGTIDKFSQAKMAAATGIVPKKNKKK